MYSFKIEAASPLELQNKLNQFAMAHVNQLKKGDTQSIPQIAVDALLTHVQTGVENDAEVEAVVESIRNAQTATVPHIHQNPVISTPVNNSDELDVRGLPYDARIHSTGKSKNQDGTWRYKRGVDNHIVEQVEKEISRIKSVASPLQNALIPPVPFSQAPAAMPSFEAPAQPVVPPLQTSSPVATPSMLVPPDQTQVPAQPEVARHPDAPSFASPTVDKMYEAFTNVDKGIVVPPGQKPAHTLQTFTNNLTDVLAQLINEKKITKEYIESLCKHFNVKYIWNVLGNATQIRELYDSFGQYGLITKLD